MLLLLMTVHAAFSVRHAMPNIQAKARMVRGLHLTDLSLFTDARYTRHPSMADLHTAFQDHPMSFEHFPSGAIVFPPSHIHSYGLDQ
ncbi:MAG: hypothetical protein RDU01_07390 [Thermodesulfovibrionales bacterium]|nr:hypothetical protein [Thermodesulfovibrionales bacterium]